MIGIARTDEHGLADLGRGAAVSRRAHSDDAATTRKEVISVLSRQVRRLIKPRGFRCGKRCDWVKGWCICQSCFEDDQKRPPAIAVAS